MTVDCWLVKSFDQAEPPIGRMVLPVMPSTGQMLHVVEGLPKPKRYVIKAVGYVGSDVLQTGNTDAVCRIVLVVGDAQNFYF